MIPMEGGGKTNATTDLARSETMLSPRFYTTDCEALDKIAVDAVRAEWDEVMAELRADANKGHFQKNAEFDDFHLEDLPPELRQEFVDSWCPP